MFHKPRFSSAVTNLAAMQPFWDVSYQYGVDIILVGHDHVYERFAPMAPNGTADPTFGIRQFTVGTGGAAAQSFGTILSTSQAAQPVPDVRRDEAHPARDYLRLALPADRRFDLH